MNLFPWYFHSMRSGRGRGLKRALGSMRLPGAMLLLLGGASLVSAQISVTGLADRTYEYDTQVRFTVNAAAGYDYLAVLDTNTIPVGQQITVTQADYHELRVWATNQTSGAVSTALYRFNVTVNARGVTENGLPPFEPLPPIPSTAAEVEGAVLRLMAPQAFPQDYPIPVVAWVVHGDGHAVRANGTVRADGFPDIGIKRGVGSGFLPAAADNDPVEYAARLHGLSASRVIVPDDSTTWTNVSGVLSGDRTWGPNWRVAVTTNLAIPAGSRLTIGEGTIVRLSPYANITNYGSIIINGTVDRPVVFMPVSPNQPWGGFFLPASSSSLQATGAIFTHSGALKSGFAGHRKEQCLFYCDNSPTVTLTDCAAISLDGQFGHAFNGGTFTFTRFLLHRAITGGEYTGASFRVNDSAFLEFPDDTPDFVDGDNDALYLVSGTHGFTNTLFGWTKDDGIDSGGGGAGTFNYQNCWFESVLHEGNSLSGQETASPHNDKIVNHYDGVFLNCGQGVEDGYGAPTGLVQRCLMTGNLTGARFGDNYDWSYYGFLTVRDSILVHNYRDVWGVNFDDWTYRVSRMDVQNNLVTVPNTNHPNNTVWDPALHRAELVPFLTIPPAAPVGIGIATWTAQGTIAEATNRLPVRLSSFTTNDVAVSYAVRSGTGATLDSGTLTFAPGEMVKWITPNIPNPEAHGLIAVLLGNPVHGEITGNAGFYYLTASIPPPTPLVTRGARWRYRDAASAAPSDWNTPAFDDSTWPEGPAQLGFGENDQATVMTDNDQITSYFRHRFHVEDAAVFASLAMWLLRDDGGVVYLNGTEVFRSPNLPAYPTAIAFNTTTLSGQNGENTIDTATLATTHLQAGTNLLAVEIHQQSATSSDLSFDFELGGQPAPPVNVANFGDTLLLYWFDSGYVLEQAAAVTGPWSTGAGASPAPVLPAAGQRFYRLRKL
ncbi:MAG: hypothetical protein JXQ71_18035 [Verrucomicrobia bacterium]|nr:hypothetical protein [Verrucomicrobiota bacterium]